ncbi:MAG: helix-turn-helix domain-containing protein [Tissierellia bacterium]|nr:helix-turn-helix domain-containing protein [Tissierellia bacterium]
MENISIIIANNLKEIRKNRRLSLDKLSDITGVSKSMLGQIERGESNPTIQTVWKIAKGLKISLTSLIVLKKPDILLVREEHISPIVADEGKFKIYPVFPFDDRKRFEILSIEIHPGSSSISEPHEKNTEEYITVYKGELTVKIGQEEYIIKSGDSIKYFADQEHSYHNFSKNITKMSMVIYYPNN